MGCMLFHDDKRSIEEAYPYDQASEWDPDISQ